jgi:CheY-like chemotaxis protein
MDALDVLVADVSLRDGTGCTLLPILRERMGGGPRLAVAVTGHDDEHWHDECRRAGFSRFLVKPVMLADLLAALDSANPSLGGVPAPHPDPS